MIVTDDRVAAFVSEQLGHAFCPPYTTLGIERDGRIVGGVIFHCFEGAAVHVTVAGKGWTRSFLQAVGRYAFQQLRCERITVTTEFEQVAAYAERIGGQREGVLRSQFGPGRDGIIVGILKAEYRFDLSQ